MKKKRIFAFLLTFVMLSSLCGCSVSAKGLVTTSQKKAAELALKGESFWKDQTAHQVGETVTVTEYKKPLSYILQYPKTGYAATDARIEAIVAEIRNAFDQEYLPTPGPDGETKREKKPDASLYLGYETYLTDETHMSLLFFETHETSDGMSPHTRIQAFHFDLSKDQEVAAEDLMWNGFTRNASAYTQKYFTTTEPYNQRLFGNYQTLLAPENGRFDRFAFTEEGVLFHFDRYDIFPGSMGIVSLTIPYADMRTKTAAPQDDAADIPASITDKKMVAITYDDGPNPVHTNAILDILEKYDARATFFDLGSLVEKYPDVVKREDALGCEVASHSWDHKNFNKITDDVIKADVERTDAAFQKALGRSPSAFRPPYGNCNDHVKKLIPLPIYLWSVDTLDWKSRNADAILEEVKKIGDLDGKVILMHGIYGSTAEATARLVPYLQEQGYELVTVSELVAAKHGETPENSKIYGYHYFQ
ncbi:MAG: polysaccharide deacetylase family protein [Anaerotignum sp.]|nr:polysaccharide deacetylase family protein [Anaerotignum sp.]